mmetsp:Transcript_11147/g.22216  ORF Transcript_11147/g.22216 Transcript_11147/m.22216 type:complete len:304 (+) Transcript_11147:30-941(+)
MAPLKRKGTTSTPPPNSKSSKNGEGSTASLSSFEDEALSSSVDIQSTSEEASAAGGELAKREFFQSQIDAVETERAQVADDTHPEVVQRSAILKKLCQRRAQAAERFRDLQIENVRGLYDYEIREADSVYQAAVAELKERLTLELRRRIERLRREKRAVENSANNGDRSGRHSSGTAGGSPSSWLQAPDAVGGAASGGNAQTMMAAAAVAAAPPATPQNSAPPIAAEAVEAAVGQSAEPVAEATATKPNNESLSSPPFSSSSSVASSSSSSSSPSPIRIIFTVAPSGIDPPSAFSISLAIWDP